MLGETRVWLEIVGSFGRHVPCPACGSVHGIGGHTQYEVLPDAHVPGNPYVRCAACKTWVQAPQPTGSYFLEAPANAGTGDQMSAAEKGVNEGLAAWLMEQAQPTSVLDIGCRYPYLLSCFMRKHGLGADRLLGVDGIPEVRMYGLELGVPVMHGNFPDVVLPIEPYSLVTMVHVLEHFPDTLKALLFAYQHMAPGASLFIRTPCVDVPGIAHHLGEAHYPVHPWLFSELGLQMLLARVPGLAVGGRIGISRDGGFMDCLARKVA